MSEILDLTKLAKAPTDATYFPYCQVDSFIQKEQAQQVVNDFPVTSIRGSIPSSKLKFGKTFQKLVDELHGDPLRELIAKKFEIDLTDAKPLLTIRGQTTLADGHIHVDTPSKRMTLLLYLNEDWQEKTGNLRLLRDASSLENYFEEITPTLGKLLVFKVTDNCWHGHYPFLGKRQTLQLNYVSSQAIVDKELKKHARSYTFKKWLHHIRHFINEKNSTR